MSEAHTQHKQNKINTKCEEKKRFLSYALGFFNGNEFYRMFSTLYLSEGAESICKDGK